MKIYTILTKNLDRFRTRSLVTPIAFYWNGINMTLYQGGSVFTLKEIFSGCYMPKSPVKGLLLPDDINNLLEAQQYIDDNKDEIMISPSEWGYDIYKLNPVTHGPLLVKSIKFYSVKGRLPLFFARILNSKIALSLKNLEKSQKL